MPIWRRRDAERIQRCGIFSLDRVSFEPPEGGEPRPFHVLDMPEWINVIAVTDELQVPMVRQYRFGTENLTLEIPGGMCDPGEAPLAAARRELKEETGYESDAWSPLGWVYPNPSIQNNRCHTFLAGGARKTAEPDLDPNERIEQVLVPLDEIAPRIAAGEISHALVIAAFRFYEQTRG